MTSTLNPIINKNKEVEEQCWICLCTELESNEPLKHLGCLCKWKTHESCAIEWYILNKNESAATLV